jgi:hypothetical protein
MSPQAKVCKMDQVIFNWAVAIAGALGGWVLKIIWDSIQDMRREIQKRDERLHDDIKEMDSKMHQDFVRRDDFKDAMKEHKEDMQSGFKEIKDMIGLLFKKLEGKADK